MFLPRPGTQRERLAFLVTVKHEAEVVLHIAAE